MEVRRLIEGYETAAEMLARLSSERPFFLFPPLHRLPLRVGNVVELVGPSLSCKTLTLIQVLLFFSFSFICYKFRVVRF